MSVVSHTGMRVVTGGPDARMDTAEAVGMGPSQPSTEQEQETPASLSPSWRTLAGQAPPGSQGLTPSLGQETHW